VSSGVLTGNAKTHQREMPTGLKESNPLVRSEIVVLSSSRSPEVRDVTSENQKNYVELTNSLPALQPNNCAGQHRGASRNST
jgi:hypothetical protein